MSERAVSAQPHSAHAPHALRTLTTGEVLDAAIRLFRRHFWHYAVVAALVQLPSLLLSHLWQHQYLLSFGLPFEGMFDYVGYAPRPRLGWSLTAGTLIALAATALAARHYHEQPTTALAGFRVAPRRYVALAVAALLLAPLSLFGALLGQFFGGLWIYLLVLFLPLYLGIVWVRARLLLVPSLCVLEGAGPVTAIWRSWMLTAHARRRVFVVLVSLELLSFLVASGPGYASLFLYIQVGVVQQSVISAALLVYSAAMPPLLLALQAVGYTVLYYTLRVRAEGYDLEFRIRQLQP